VKRRRILITLVTVLFFVLGVVPAVVVFSQDWLLLPHHAQLPGQPAQPSSTINAWTVFALFYVVWMAADFALLVIAYDRLGYKYMPPGTTVREPRARRRRRAVGMGFLEARERARTEGGVRPRRTSRTAQPDPMAGRPPRRPPSERGPRDEPPPPHDPQAPS
jgi:hypothetical protein